MILKTYPMIRNILTVCSLICRLKFGKYILVAFMFFQCYAEKKDPDRKPESDILAENIMNLVDENPAYQKFGLLKLSEYGFFEQPLNLLQPIGNVLPYDLNTPLFTDFALKKRFIYLPEDSLIHYNNLEPLSFPEGTVLIKNFYYSHEQLGLKESLILETRLLIKNEGEWIALPYIWNSSQTEAYLELTGGIVPVKLAKNNQSFEFLIPTIIQCKSCHELNGEMVPIGPTVRQLNRDFPYSSGDMNQIDKIIEQGWMVDNPNSDEWPKLAQWDQPESGSLDDRARAYLDINCGHCHRPEGPAKNSGLDLTIFASNEYNLGINKSPVAAGAGSGDLKYDIYPGNPDKSILVYRMKSYDPGIMMPELGRSLIHEEGLKLIEKWIDSLD